jgi:predicted chitinase
MATKSTNYISPTDSKKVTIPFKFTLNNKQTATIDRIVLSESPIKVKVFGSYDSSKAPKGGGVDAMHSFQSRSKDDFGGRMNDAIIISLLEVYERGINPFVESLSITISPNKKTGPIVSWEAIITQSKDDKAYVGFQSRGAGGGGYKTRSVTQAKDKKKSLPKETGEPDMVSANVIDYINDGAQIRQIFWQYTKPKAYPPNPKKQETVNPVIVDEKVEQYIPIPDIEEVIPEVIPMILPPIKLQMDFNFDVRKEKTFIITSGNNGNLVTLPDGSTIDIGELTLVKNEDPFDPFIIRLLTPYSDEYLELDEEYTDVKYDGMADEDVFLSPQGDIDKEFLDEAKGYDPQNPDEDTLSVDDNYKYPISKDIEKNILIIIQAANDAGIWNGWTIAAMIAVSKKECELVPQNERTYAGTKAKKIKSVFGAMSKYEPAEIDRIKKKPDEFFNIVYGGKNGNGPNKTIAESEGYKFRGRGLNQLTFRGNYEMIKKRIGIDIVSDPDKVNTIEVAAKVLVEYMKYKFGKADSGNKAQYNFTDINSFKNIDDATGAVYHANAGFGKSMNKILADVTGGRAKTFKYVGHIYEKYLKGKNKK